MMTALQHQEALDKTTKVSRESHATQSYPSRTIVHAKLEMTEPGDHDELEAEEMANTIVSGGKISRKISGGASGSSGIAVSQQMEHQLAHLQGGGQQMPEGLRNMMENDFGRDFSQVRLHTDSEAAEMSSSIHAKAFTHGNDIYFNRGQFSPETSEGQHLVAHELTHVVQGSGKVGRYDDNPALWDPYARSVVGGPDLSKDESAESNENILKKGYEELQKLGILLAVNDEVYEFSSEFLKDPEGFKKSGRLSKNALAWLEKVEKQVGKLNKGSHVFVILNKALTVVDACKLVYKAKYAMSRNASGLQQAEFAADAGFFFIGVVGGIPGAVFTASYKFFWENISDYTTNHPRETQAGILDFLGLPSDFGRYLNPMNYFGW